MSMFITNDLYDGRLIILEAEDGIYKKPWLVNRLKKIKSRIYTKVGKLDVRMTADAEPIPREALGERRFRKIRPHQVWGKAFACAWFRLGGRVPQSASGRHVVLLVDIDGEGVCVDGSNEPLTAITNKMCWVDRVQSTSGKIAIEFSSRCKGGEAIDLLVDGSFNGKIIQPYFFAVFKRADIATCRDDIKDFYYDYLTASFFLAASDGGEKERELSDSLDRAYAVLKHYTPDEVAEAKNIIRPVLEKHGDADRLAFTAIGHSHLDLAWLWPIRETKRKAVRTFTTALNNIAKYPATSTAQASRNSLTG
jgi:alpha-mannosidase